MSNVRDRTAYIPGTMMLAPLPLPAYTSVGCYPIFYLRARSGTTYCHICARTEGLTEKNGHVHWEGRPLECDTCGQDIESAYGDPEESEVRPE